MSIDADLFRSVLGRFATGITVITTRDTDGTDHGMTVSAFSSLSLDPPLVLACIAHDATMAPVIADAAYFVVNILAEGQEPLSRRFAGKLDDRFTDLGHTRSEHALVILDDSLAWIECQVVERHVAGDHTIYIGSVEQAGAHDARPLLYYRGGYAQLEH